MKDTALRKVLFKIRNRWYRSLGRIRPQDEFLRHCKGVVHVGANTGQEREVYERHGLNVLWIEPIPDVFQELERNISGLGKQRAVKCLVTDRDNARYEFRIASNGGASSSIFDFKKHREMFPEVGLTATVTLVSKRFDTLIHDERIDLSLYNALVIDTQGSELLVLQGAGTSLTAFEFIQIELPDFEAYAGCCTVKDVVPYLKARSFALYSRHLYAANSSVGSCYELVFRRKA